MSCDNKQLISIIVPVVIVVFGLIITAAIVQSRRCRQRTLLSTTEPLFTKEHIASLRGWQKPQAPVTLMDSPWPKLRTDPNHSPLLAAPIASHQPERPIQKGAWQDFKEKQAQRKEWVKEPLEEWHYESKGSAYWKEVGKQMHAETTFWEKVKDKLGFVFKVPW
jgi:hypothetical protein